MRLPRPKLLSDSEPDKKISFSRLAAALYVSILQNT